MRCCVACCLLVRSLAAFSDDRTDLSRQLETRTGRALNPKEKAADRKGFSLPPGIDLARPLTGDAALALLPIVTGGLKPGQEIEHPMAVVILGGLFTSTALNLFLMPALYWRFGRGRQQA